MKKFFVLPAALLLLFISFNTLAQTDTLFNQTDASGMKQGWWKKSYPNGKLMYKGYFRNNKPVGEMRRFHENGVIKAVLKYDPAGETARVTLYYADGQKAAEGKYFGTQKDSTWTYFSYYNHTPTVRENFVRGVREGQMLHYYTNGTVSEKLNWKADKQDGAWEQYFNNQVLKLRGNYVNGKLEGEFLVNYEDGKPYLRGRYVNDLREGKWVIYDEKGGVARQMTYQKGVSPDEEKLDERQQEMFRMIEENKGKIEEPDEINFMSPGGR
jgi:antitoxin component YwqK of YwqJK toxin-antitoxin module